MLLQLLRKLLLSVQSLLHFVLWLLLVVQKYLRLVLLLKLAVQLLMLVELLLLLVADQQNRRSQLEHRHGQIKARKHCAEL